MSHLVRDKRLGDFPHTLFQFSRPFRGGGFRDWHCVKVRQEGDRVLCKVHIIGHIDEHGSITDLSLVRLDPCKIPFRQIWLPADLRINWFDPSD